jgi:type II secretory ATPase GspE/PulE/Tfp pilus assembly ATPase PilB-like protein
MGWTVVADLPARFALLGDVSVGGYANGFKLIPSFVILLIWTRLLTWADKDADEAYLPRVPLNISFVCGMVLALVLFFFLPSYLIALPAFLLIFVAEIATYLVLRKRKVGLGDLQKRFGAWARSFGGKPKEVVAAAGQVGLIGKSGVMPAPAAESPERLAYDGVQILLTDPLRKGADYIQLSQNEGAAQIKYLVDGMSYDGPSIPKPEAGAAIGMLKQLAGLAVEEKRKPQRGTMKVSLNGKKHELRVLTRGSTAGESTAIDVDMKNRHTLTLDDMGFSESQLKRLSGLTAGGGLVLVATPPAQGLTTLLYALARKHDAFLSHIHTIERSPDDELEGITQNKLAGDASPAEESKLVAWVTSQEPDVLIVDRVDDPHTAAELLRFAGTGKRVYVGIRAGNTLDALAAWLKLIRDEKAATKNLELVIAGRLLRKLCMACKVEYSPDPETLRRLNMSPDKVGSLFQARSQPLRDPKGNQMVCDFCTDMHFKGRVGVFEIFAVDDEVRQTVAAGGSVNQLKMLFKKQKQRYLQEQAVAKAVAGDTSLQEVARMLKSGEGPSSGGSTSRQAKPKPAPRPSTAG